MDLYRGDRAFPILIGELFGAPEPSKSRLVVTVGASKLHRYFLSYRFEDLSVVRFYVNEVISTRVMSMWLF